MDGAVVWEQSLPGVVISEARGKGTLKENLPEEISQPSLSVRFFLLVDIPGAKVEIMRPHISLGPRPTTRLCSTKVIVIQLLPVSAPGLLNAKVTY